MPVTVKWANLSPIGKARKVGEWQSRGVLIVMGEAKDLMGFTTEVRGDGFPSATRCVVPIGKGLLRARSCPGLVEGLTSRGGYPPCGRHW
jgi:hypothetical protein